MTHCRAGGFNGRASQSPLLRVLTLWDGCPSQMALPPGVKKNTKPKSASSEIMLAALGCRENSLVASSVGVHLPSSCSLPPSLPTRVELPMI